jgi:N6-L-threonylcarbamoyladenine synthase
MILAIESSCDESALALFDPARGLLGEWVHSQIAAHRAHGGVVPDIASRQHLAHLPVLLREALAGTAAAGGRVERLAVTAGPGLAGCLALGMALARALGLAWGVPVAGVNHLRGHVFSPFLPLHAADPRAFRAAYAAHLPHLGLVVSGGNTLLLALAGDGSLRVLAETVDDAAGEALDKGAKLLGMDYPGGPLIERAARAGDPVRQPFPRACGGRDQARFSFSGLKTSLRYRLEKMSDAQLAAGLPDLCAGYQEAVVQALARKTRQFLRAGGWRSLGLSGGVANNGRLRAEFGELGQRAGLPVLIAEPRHTGDNAAMIAFAAWIDPQGCRAAAAGFDPGWRVD